MKFCKVCLQEFSADLDQCPKDGNSLVLLKGRGSEVIGQLLDGKYKIFDKIGSGGCGEVYQAYQLSTDRVVAIKILSESLSGNTSILQRFVRESKALAKLSHPNIVTIFDSGSTDSGIMYMVMEYLEGLPLNNFIDEEPIPLHQLIDFSLQICDALIEAHSKGIIHRDLKPPNIIIESKKSMGFMVKVLDFGLSKILNEKSAVKLSITGFTFGTPYYMSPEQACGKTNIDHETDIYSLGIIMYEMVTGRKPFEGNNPLEIIGKQIHEQPRAFEMVKPGLKVPQRLNDLVFKCLEKSPNRRPQSVDEVKTALILCREELREELREKPPQGIASIETEVTEPAEYADDFPLLASERPPRIKRISLLLIAAIILLSGATIVLVKFSGLFDSTPPEIKRTEPVTVTKVLPINPENKKPVSSSNLDKVDSSTESTPKTEEPEEKAEPLQIKINVKSRPKGASVFQATTLKRLGTTDFELIVKGEKRLPILFKLAGFYDKKIVVDPKQTRDKIVVALIKKEPRTLPVTIRRRVPPPIEQQRRPDPENTRLE